MSGYTEISGLKVAEVLAAFIETEALPGTGISSNDFWPALSAFLHEFGPRNRALLEKREALQAQIDDWHIRHRNQPHDHAAYYSFLEGIGYLIAEGDPFEIETENTDPEIASVPGPQLVVSITNARYALNAANG